MPQFELKQSTRHMTSCAGLILVGQCLDAARLDLLDKKFPTPKGQNRTADIVKRYAGLLALGKSDFEAIEAFRKGRFFKRVLQIDKVPSSVWRRQRMEKLAVALREATDGYSVHLLQRAGAPIRSRRGMAMSVWISIPL